MKIFSELYFLILCSTKTIDLQSFGHLLYRLYVAVFVSSNILEHQPQSTYNTYTPIYLLYLSQYNVTHQTDKVLKPIFCSKFLLFSLVEAASEILFCYCIYSSIPVSQNQSIFNLNEHLKMKHSPNVQTKPHKFFFKQVVVKC